MDSGQQTAADEAMMKAYVAECIQIIKTRMPETYKALQTKAEELGNEAYALVRQGIRGKPNCFYAVEGGHVVGTPFDMPDLTGDMARQICQFGCKSMVLFGVPKVAA